MMRNLLMKLGLASFFLCKAGLSADTARFDALMNEEFAELERPPSEASDFLLRQIERTPEQPLGPFYPIRRPAQVDTDLTTVREGAKADGVVIYVQGQVKDLDGNAIPHAQIEIWQACASGKYNHPRDVNPAIVDPNFQYFAVTSTDETGSYVFKTILPGAYPASRDWWRPPHIHFSITAPGFNPLVTQLYFDGASFVGTRIGEYNENDLILSRLPPEQRAKLIVPFSPSDDLDGHLFGVFNIYLEGN